MPDSLDVDIVTAQQAFLYRKHQLCCCSLAARPVSVLFVSTSRLPWPAVRGGQPGLECAADRCKYLQTGYPLLERVFRGGVYVASATFWMTVECWLHCVYARSGGTLGELFAGDLGVWGLGSIYAHQLADTEHCVYREWAQRSRLP
jgi:hypothetical protein